MRRTFVVGPQRTIERIERYLPGDVPRRPALRFSIAPSWNALAAEYAEIVDRQIAGAKLDRFLGRTLKGADGRREKIDRLLARVHEEVRYTGVEFAEAAIVPRPPAVTLERRCGDCKDKAALLVALLRNAGIPAHIALLSAGSSWDVDPELPDLGVFNHAIVVAPGEPDIWIDATAEPRPSGELPVQDWGHLFHVTTLVALRLPESNTGLDDATGVLQRITRAGLGHRELTSSKEGGVLQNGSTPPPGVTAPLATYHAGCHGTEADRLISSGTSPAGGIA